MKSNKQFFLSITLAAVVLAGCSKDDDNKGTPDNIPSIDSADFSNPLDITNPFYGPGQHQVYVYEGGEVGITPEEEIRIERKASTRVVMGIDYRLVGAFVRLRQCVVRG